MVNWNFLEYFKKFWMLGKEEMMMKGIEIWYDFIDGLRYNTRLTANVSK